MKKISVAIQILTISFIGYLTLFLLTDYLTPQGRNDLPFVVFVIDTIDLFIHEGGHGVFQIFGEFVGFLGGSLMQVILPTAAIVVFLKSGIRSLIVTLYWLGHNLVNISVYIGDAPYRQLRLISKHAIHDWGWICDRLEITHHAEDIAAVVLFFGATACLGSIGVGIYTLVHDTRGAFTQGH